MWNTCSSFFPRSSSSSSYDSNLLTNNNSIAGVINKLMPFISNNTAVRWVDLFLWRRCDVLVHDSCVCFLVEGVVCCERARSKWYHRRRRHHLAVCEERKRDTQVDTYLYCGNCTNASNGRSGNTLTVLFLHSHRVVSPMSNEAENLGNTYS